MAHKKGLGSSRNGRESNPNMLGVKVFAGQQVTGSEIIVASAAPALARRGRRHRPRPHDLRDQRGEGLLPLDAQGPHDSVLADD